MKQNNSLPPWITELTEDNLLAVYDVVLDISSELQMSDDVAIPLLQTAVKFPPLMPGDSISMRDRYCEFRWKACGLLKKQGIIQDVEVLQAGHRWGSRLRILCRKSEIAVAKKLLEEEYENRFSPKKAKEKKLGSTVTQSKQLGIENVRRIVLRFHAVAIQLRDRHEDRPTLDVSDEYDVQDLLHALLCLEFDDVRPEEWTPSYAGKSARVDFLLKPEEVVIEVKKTRAGLSGKEIGDQLILDIARYSKMKGCRTLICMVYDPENRILNPGGLESDLSGMKEGLNVEVVVVPKRY